MANALEGVETPKPTLREEANAPRIGRARFIGHTVGFLLIILAAEFGLTFAGFKETRRIGAESVALPHHWLAVAGSLAMLLALLDLAIRRRHDRDRSGADAVVALLVLEAAFLATVPGSTVQIPSIAVGIAAGLAGLYLLVMLVILPGSKTVNRYGRPPGRD